MGLDDIASGIHGIREQVLDEIEAIVGAGTKVSLDHILEESLDEDCLEELFEFFRESEDEGLDAAKEEFEDAYSEEELRLARIKFLSEIPLISSPPLQRHTPSVLRQFLMRIHRH